MVDIVSDAYSTEFPCEYQTANAKIEKSPVRVNEALMSKASVSYKDGEIDCVYDAWAKIQNVASRLNTDAMKINVMGSILYCVMIRTDSGMPVMLECETPFEQTVSSDRLTADSVLEPNVCVMSCSYNLTSTNTVELKSEIRITGCIEEAADCRIITDISVDEETVKPRDGDYALKLYFADSGEDIWEIAKKYSTSVSAIMEENDLSENIISERGMILIPII